jgi:hypothetical protein
LEDGLRQMLKDGSFDKLFLKYYGEDIRRANLESRKVFTIKNPFLSSKTPFEDSRLWFDPLHLNTSEHNTLKAD